MKILCLRRKKAGFTLVELLVVIAIIAILAGVILSGITSAIKFAKRTKANATASQIQTAVQSFYTEYGIYPTAGAVGGDDYYSGLAAGGAKWAQLTIALCGNIDPATGITAPTTVTGNTRSIPYLAPTRGDLDTNFPAPNHTFKNPFSAGAANPIPYFYMAVDTDYSGVVGDTTPAQGQLPDFSATKVVLLTHGVTGGVAVWCSCDQTVVAGSTSAFWAHTY